MPPERNALAVGHGGVPIFLPHDGSSCFPAGTCRFRKAGCYCTSEPPRTLECYTTVDLASTEGNDSDYNVVMTTGKDVSDTPSAGTIYELETWRKQTSNVGEVIDELFAQHQRWHPLKVGVALAAYEKTLMYWLKEKMRERQEYMTIVTAANYQKSKHGRILGLVPIFQCGRFMQKPNSLIRSELLMYPKGAHDDVIDALSVTLSLWEITPTANQQKPSVDPALATADDIYEELNQARRSSPTMEDLYNITSIDPYVALGLDNEVGDWSD